jgi:hypothetical protein
MAPSINRREFQDQIGAGKQCRARTAVFVKDGWCAALHKITAHDSHGARGAGKALCLLELPDMAGVHGVVFSCDSYGFQEFSSGFMSP